MAGLTPDVHVQLEKHLEKNATAHQRLFRIYDTVEALPDIQIRTVITKTSRGVGDNRFFCIQSTVDYTKYVHGDSDYESNLHYFYLPADAIKQLATEHLRDIESEVRDLRWQLNADNWVEGGIQFEEDEEAEDEEVDEASESAGEKAAD